MTVPLIVKKQGKSEVVGVLQFFSKETDDIVHENDMELINVIAGVCASVADNAGELHTAWMIVHEFRKKV